MAKKTFVVMGATGQIGSVVCEELLKRGHTVRALGRDPQKLEVLKSWGAEVIQIEKFDSKEALTKAFKGADGAFVMLPPGYGVEKFAVYQAAVGEAIKEALQKNSIPYVVNLSSLGAHLPEGTGPIKGLHAQEKRLSSLTDSNIVFLRPAYFMENFFWAMPDLLHSEVLNTPLKADLSLPMVATADIGQKAAELLDNSDFEGHEVFELVGPRNYTMNEAARIIGNAIGKPDLRYMQIPLADLKRGMLSGGAPPEMTDLLVEMYQAFNDNKCQPTQELTDEHKGKITFEQFANAFAEVYKNQEQQKATLP